MVFIKHFDLPRRCVIINIFVTFFLSPGRFKDQEFSFQAVNLLEIQLFQTCFGRVFAYFQEKRTL